MTDISFLYEDYKNTRKQLVKNVNDSLTSVKLKNYFDKTQNE